MRKVSSTSRCSPVWATSPRSISSSIEARISAIAASSRLTSLAGFSAIRLVIATRGSCSTAWPRPTPSASETPMPWIGRSRPIEAPGRASDFRPPAAIISAMIMAVVWSDSISSSL